jgi:CYTH domain-containing protein
MIPKYAILEIERRWLAWPERLPDLSLLESMLIDDIYFPHTRLRLRKMSLAVGHVYKLGKKYGKTSEIEEPIVNIYLDEAEYVLLATLPGRQLIRKRYHYRQGNLMYFINVTVHGGGPIIVEAEYASQEKALADTPPDFCGAEISADVEFEAAQFAVAASSLPR